MSQNIFESGGTWLKVDFHLHTRADKEFEYKGEENNYLKSYVQALSNAEVSLGVITNHNKFDKEEFKKLRRTARKSEIGLLPGIELSVKDGHSGVHTIVVFSDDWFDNKSQTNHIQTFLSHTFSGIENFEYINSISNHNIEQTVEILDDYELDYFLIFAHVDADKGLWKELRPGRISALFNKDTIRRRILGFQKVRTKENRSKIQKALGDLYPAEVEGCDAKKLEDFSIRDTATYLKLGNFDFESVKFALKNKMVRVSNELVSYNHSYIRKIKFEGAGALGGTQINLSPELNTLIGIRGSGKSTMIEGIRYVLDIPFGDKATDIQYKKDLLAEMLQSGGSITLDAIDGHGQPYQIRRILNEEPQVLVNGILQPGVFIRQTILNNPVYFGQKDLTNTSEGFDKDLINKLAGDALVEIQKKIKQGQQDITNVIKQLQNQTQNSLQGQEWEEKKQDVEFKLNIYQKHGFGKQLQKQIDFDRDERRLVQGIEGAKSYLSELHDFLGQFEGELIPLTSYQSKENKEFFEDFFSVYNLLHQGFDDILRIASEGQSSVELLEKKLLAFQQKKQALREEFAEIERKFASELKKDGIVGFNSDEFRQLKASLERYEELLKISHRGEEISTNLNKELEIKLNDQNNLWLREYHIIQQVLDKFNQVDSPLKIEPYFKGDKEEMFRYVQDLFRGSRIRETTLRKIVNNFADFGALWCNKEDAREYLGNSFEKFWENFEENLNALLTWQVSNSYKIEYYGKALKDHSLGQRASALLLSLLNQKDFDVVIIDQPEDDLDNQTIYNDVIKLIRELKLKTQFIFATHNANFPVLGDAEQIFACEFLDDKIQVLSGSIDCPEIQQRIVNVMEGGVEAFEKRKQVYEGWKPKK